MKIFADTQILAPTLPQVNASLLNWYGDLWPENAIIYLTLFLRCKFLACCQVRERNKSSMKAVGVSQRWSTNALPDELLPLFDLFFIVSTKARYLSRKKNGWNLSVDLCQLTTKSVVQDCNDTVPLILGYCCHNRGLQWFNTAKWLHSTDVTANWR